MTIQEKKSPPQRPRVDPSVIDVESPTASWRDPDNSETESEPGTELVISKKTELEETLLALSQTAMSGDSTVEELDTKNRVDAQVAKVSGEDVGDLLDITRLAGTLSEDFCISPIQYSGQIVHRRWHVANGTMYFFVGRSIRVNRWSMLFEPGTVIAPRGGDRKKDWAEHTLPIPHVPAQYRGASSDPRFIVWKQNWQNHILLPTNPVVIDHVAGDVYRLIGGWKFSSLEIAAMRKAR